MPIRPAFPFAPPPPGALVRVIAGTNRGALGILRYKESRWGRADIEVLPGQAGTQGPWIKAAAWRLGPANR
ncbi:MAG: hypothetical protein U0Q22_03595 [Acidimicrobiales bacterium]